ncbi:primosomal protein N' [Frateuria aurantia]
MSAALRIALPVPLPNFFDYRLPQGPWPLPGTRVEVPFGRGKRVGVVTAVVDDSPLDESQLKPIVRVLDHEPLLDAELLANVLWASSYWMGAPGEALSCALPQSLRETGDWPGLGEPGWRLTALGLDPASHGQRRGQTLQLLQQLQATSATEAELDVILPGWRDAARRLRSAGLLERFDAIPDAPPWQPRTGLQLNPEQQQAAQQVIAGWGQYQAYVLDGVTGSGKTEVYLSLIEQALARQEQVLLLIPEISLAPQTGQRLRERLGIPIDVLHSNLSEGARAKAWMRARAGLARVIVGTRSAVFTPLPRAGLIVVDEEHDGAYKQQEGFRYHARDLALVRARRLGIPVVLGSATPSLESLANVAAGRYVSLPLRQRPGGIKAPAVQLVDVRAQRLEHGLSATLLGQIDATVARGEQVLVFRNRRGYAPVLLCYDCGWHAECPRCQQPMTLHQSPRRLLCHHCDHVMPVPTACPGCGSAQLTPQGQGTERLEEVLTARYPDIPVLRVDRETTRRRHSLEQLLGQLDNDRPAILVGTQMLAKGHDLPNLTLVAIVSVDEGLHSVDFRATERLAQLVIQVAGRAGRASKPGKVLLQTHHPDHPLLRSLLTQGYPAVARELLAERQMLELPPYGHQILLRADAHRADAWQDFLGAAAARLQQAPGFHLAGPMPAPMPVRAGRQRGQLLLEGSRRTPLHQAMRQTLAELRQQPAARRVRWSVDVDPVDLY